MRVNRIKISNFKNIDYLDLDFQGKDIIIFDGPNGFGKTTFFDALELVITGKISRISNKRGKGGFDTLLLSKDQSKESLIKVEFMKDEENIVLCRKTDLNEDLTRLDKRPDSWEMYHTYKLNNYEDDIYIDEKKITQSQVNVLLGEIDHNRLFNLFFYVQQEETAFYLKKSEQKRMESISSLFDTALQNEERKRVASFKNQLRNLITSKNLELEKEKALLPEKSSLNEKYLNEEYVKISPTDDLLGIWDSKELEIKSAEELDRYIEIIDNLLKLKKDEINFTHNYSNEVIDKMLNDTSRLNQIILFKYYLEHNATLLKQLKELKEQNQIKDLLQKYNVNDQQSIPLKEMEMTKLMSPEYYLNFKRLLLSQEELSKNNTKLETINTNIISARENLNKQFKELHRHSPGDIDSNCPYCGATYSSHEEVIKHFSEYNSTFEELLSHNAQQLNFLNDEITALVEEYKTELSISLENLENKRDLLEVANEISKSTEDIQNDINSLKKLSIDFEKYQIESEEEIQSFQNKATEFVTILNDNKHDINSNYLAFESHKVIFRALLNSSFSLLDSIEINKLKQKKRYYKSIFWEYNSKIHKEVSKKILNTKKVIENYKIISDKLSRIETIYDIVIAEHQNKITKSIELPFYIYSSKIIKNHQLGSGYFIDTDVSDRSSKMRFTSNLQIDHDAVNYLSSGQLSALVISFSLALNKSYDTDFNTILIDDPVQTMDDMNLYSFIDLLANEFSNKQFFFSTHETDKAQFLEYKFDLYGFTTKRVNMKRKLLNV